VLEEAHPRAHESIRRLEAGMEIFTHVFRSRAKAIRAIAHLVLVDRFRPRKDQIKMTLRWLKGAASNVLSGKFEPQLRSCKSSTTLFEDFSPFAAENTTPLSSLALAHRRQSQAHQLEIRRTW
jgi:hypothetical protein